MKSLVMQGMHAVSIGVRFPESFKFCAIHSLADM